MAGEYDEKFEKITGILQELQISVGGLDEQTRKNGGGLEELRMEVRDIRNELRENTSNVKSLTRKVDLLSGQFTDVAGMAINDHSRIDNLENRVEVLEG